VVKTNPLSISVPIGDIMIDPIPMDCRSLAATQRASLKTKLTELTVFGLKDRILVYKVQSEAISPFTPSPLYNTISKPLQPEALEHGQKGGEKERPK
jgi:hypothetical protein